MKILFSTGWAEKQPNAITKIVIQVAEELSRRGHQCVMCGVCTDRPGVEQTDGSVTIHRLPAIKPIVKSSQLLIKLTRQTGSIAAARRRMIKKHPFSAAMLFVKYHPLYEKNIEQPRYEKQLKNLISRFEPDAVFCTCMPVKGVKTVMGSDISTPRYIWQMDPWGLHKLYNDREVTGDVPAELEAFGRAKHIFTTVPLHEQYLERDDYSVYKDKITPVEFPNVKKYIPGDVKSPVEFDPEYINLLFCGTISDDVRNPEKLLKDIADLKDEKIRLYFMGEGNSSSLDKYAEAFPGAIIKAGRFSARQAAAAMDKADILVNISNIVDNMVPSKIFDYFSMGKPVLNLQKITNCPSRRYFDKYPLAMTIEDFSRTDKDRLLQFLKSSKGKQIPFEEIENLYHTATVEYVAEQLESELSKK